MKTIKVTTDNTISVIDVDFDDFRAIQKAIGGYFETVKTKKMLDFFGEELMMIVNEEGHIEQLPFNELGSYFYDTDYHGCPIVGDFILAVPSGENIIGFENAEAIKEKLLDSFDFLKEVTINE